MSREVSSTVTQPHKILLHDLGVFYPPNTPKWSFWVGKPMVVGYHHFRKPPFVAVFFLVFFASFWQALLRSRAVPPPSYHQNTGHKKLLELWQLSLWISLCRLDWWFGLNLDVWKTLEDEKRMGSIIYTPKWMIGNIQMPCWNDSQRSY